VKQKQVNGHFPILNTLDLLLLPVGQDVKNADTGHLATGCWAEQLNLRERNIQI
jgi:hypothetical protein